MTRTEQLADIVARLRMHAAQWQTAPAQTMREAADMLEGLEDLAELAEFADLAEQEQAEHVDR